MFESTGVLRRPKIGRDSSQGVTQDLAAASTIIAQDVPCSVQEKTAGVLDAFGQRQTVSRTQVYTMDDIGARVNDVFDATNDLSGVTVRYLVQSAAKEVQGRLQAPWVMDVEVLRGPVG
jgi:hypothetical protein